jgi:hypothetical protein
LRAGDGSWWRCYLHVIVVLLRDRRSELHLCDRASIGQGFRSSGATLWFLSFFISRRTLGHHCGIRSSIRSCPLWTEGPYSRACALRASDCVMTAKMRCVLDNQRTGLHHDSESEVRPGLSTVRPGAKHPVHRLVKLGFELSKPTATLSPSLPSLLSTTRTAWRVVARWRNFQVYCLPASPRHERRDHFPV